MDTFRRTDCVRDELFRAIERYDIKKLLKAGSNSSLGVISEEELHKLLKHKSKQWMREEFKRLILENGRLKNFAAFILDYNSHVQKAALAALQNESRFNTGTRLPLPANAYTRNKLKGPPDFADDKGSNNCSQEYSSATSSSNSRTPPSPMEVDTKVSNASGNLSWLHWMYAWSLVSIKFFYWEKTGQGEFSSIMYPAYISY